MTVKELFGFQEQSYLLPTLRSRSLPQSKRPDSVIRQVPQTMIRDLDSLTFPLGFCPFPTDYGVCWSLITTTRSIRSLLLFRLRIKGLTVYTQPNVNRLYLGDADMLKDLDFVRFPHQMPISCCLLFETHPFPISC
jgi:hypothetical protein